MTDEEHRDKLYSLLPAVYRKRDKDERGEALRQFLRVLDDESLIIEENLAQLYDDLFAETASAWVLPYIAELIGLRGLPGTDSMNMTPRAEVANTIRYRRRKGTAAVLEQLARDVTGWPARAVEYFELLAGTQYMNHIRPRNQSTVNIRDAGRLQWANTPFERLTDEDDLTHLVEVRRIASRRGRYNIPNIGIHLWRLRAYQVTQSPAVPAGDGQRFFISPLGINMQLFNHPVGEGDITHLAEPQDVPMQIGRRMFSSSRETYYPTSLRISLHTDELASAKEIDVKGIVVCDLSDTEAGWAHTVDIPDDKVAVDPVLGRVAFSDVQETPPKISYYYGFSADIGGGEYDRVHTFNDMGDSAIRVSNLTTAEHSTIDDALDEIPDGNMIVEIGDSGHYAENPTISAFGRRVEIRSAEGRRAFLNLPDELEIKGDSLGEVTLNGLLIAGRAIRLTGIRRVSLRHCTLVPGINLEPDGESEQPGAPSIFVDSPETELIVDSCILGGLRVNVDARVSVWNSIIDAGIPNIAYTFEDEDGISAGGRLQLRNCTVLGKVHTRVMEMASNTIFLARRTDADDPQDWPGPVVADRRQEGCVRFSYLPAGSRTPRRYHCQPEREADAARLRPVMTSLRYADPGYCQLDRRTPAEIRLGADDESEMGVFHDLFQPQREHYLQTRLDDYLRFGLEAGIFFAS
jgi:hypothetical protein